jgi:hypothetical protein
MPTSLEVGRVGGVMWVRVWLAGTSLAGRWLAGTLIAGSLGACAAVDPVDNRYDTISRSLAKARNESIFLNIVRASHDYPLSFVVVSNVTPAMTNTTSLALPSFLFGPSFGGSLPTAAGRDVVFGSTTAANSTAVSSNFNLSTQETSSFYEGFLKPIDLQTLDYFIRQGYPRELLFWLFTDAFELKARGHSYGYHYAPPDDYGCNREDRKTRCFVDWVHQATLAGLTVEEQTLQKSSSGGAKSGGDPSAKPSSDPSGGGSKPTTTIFARFCFNHILAQQAMALVTPDDLKRSLHDLDVRPDELYASDLTCGSRDWHPVQQAESPQSDVLPLNFKKSNIVFSIIPRSAYGVFQFLGTLMKMRRLLSTAPGLRYHPPNEPFIPPDREYALEPPMLLTVRQDPDLLQVMHNLGGECFVHTWFRDGNYCVPEEAATTKRIFGLLAQLIAIQTAAGDLSITPIVRIVQ